MNFTSVITNWKTSASGLAAILAAIAHMLATRTAGAEDLTSIFTGIGLIFAKDGTTHSTTAQVEAATVKAVVTS